MQLTADLVSRSKLAFPMILKWLDRGRLQIGGVTPNGHRAGLAGRLAATAHTRVETQSALVQIGMGQSVDDIDSLLRIENEHLAEEVDGLVRRLRRQRIQSGQCGRLSRAANHVFTGGLAGARHVLHVWRAQQIRNELQLNYSAAARRGKEK